MLVTIAQHKFLLSKLCQVFHNNTLVVKIMGLLMNLTNLPICYDDDDDEERSDSLDKNIISGLPPCAAITPNEPILSTEEPDNSPSMGDEHLDIILATESDEVIKSSVEDLIPIPSKSEGIPDHRCDVPSHDNSPPLDVSKDQFEDFSESNEEFSSTDDDSFFFDKIDYVEASPPDSKLVSSEVDAFLAVEDEPTSSQFPKSYLDSEGDMLLLEAFLNDDHSSDFKTKSSSTSLNSLLEETNNFDNSLPEFPTFSNVLFDAEYESDSSDDQSCSDEDVLEKIVSKPLSEEELIPMKSLRTHDSSLLNSSKIDSLLEEFAGELTLLKSIPPGIDETERAAKAQNWKLPVCYDDDDDEEISDSLDDNIISRLPPFSAITPDEPVLSTEDPDNSLSMEDEHLDTIPAMESDEFIKSSVETLILIPSESEGIPDHMCDVLSHDNSPPLDVSKDQFEDFSEFNEEFSSTDDDSFSFDKIDYVEASALDSKLVGSKVMEIVIPKVGGIKASNDNPIPFYDTIISGTPLSLTPSGESDFFLETKSSSTSLNSLLEETLTFDNSLPEFTTFLNDPFDAKYESDSSDDQSCSDEDVLETIVSKPLCEEEIIPMKSLQIDETNCDFEEDIRLIEKLLYNNSSPRLPEEFFSANSDAKIKSFSPFPILVKDSDSLMEEIDLLCTPDYPMSPGIMDKDYDSERYILIPKDLPINNSLSFAKKESFYFDIPSFSHPPTKPPDGDTGILNIKMMGDISDQKAFMHKLMITLASHQEKSPDLISHWCETVKKFNTHHSHLNKCPMLIHG
nr:hypothetical protein [Tanacetum cinerariifolium]